MGRDIILFLDDDPARAALAHQRMPERYRQNTFWAQTTEEAIYILRDYASRLMSAHLDHDLGGEQFVHSSREDCGMEVVRWLERQDPKLYDGCVFVIHTWNIPAGIKMAERLQAAGYKVHRRPFGN
jgi:hypothetical protein